MKIEITNITRTWWYPEHEVSKEALQFSYKDSHIYLVPDKDISKMWNLHFGDCLSLTSEERLGFFKEIIEWLPTGSYLGTAGTSTKGGESGFRKLGYYMKDTGCLRVLHDKTDGHETYFPIYKKVK